MKTNAKRLAKSKSDICEVVVEELVDAFGLLILVSSLEGEAEMITNHALEDYEVERGFVLTCQCLPLSDTLIIDYDRH